MLTAETVDRIIREQRVSVEFDVARVRYLARQQAGAIRRLRHAQERQPRAH
jgi:hypothetical protein